MSCVSCELKDVLQVRVQKVSKLNFTFLIGFHVIVLSVSDSMLGNDNK
jgi:hypothetical protein